MSEKLFVNPVVPYCGLIPDGLGVNKMVRIQGVADRNGDRFDINLQTGRSTKPRDDTVLHLSVRLKQGYIARNSYQSGTWGDEQGAGPLPIGAGLQFEILILADLHDFKIAVNGQHFCEFPQRFSLEQVSYLVIQGDVHLTLISWEESLVQPSAPLAGGEHANQSSPMSHGPPPMAPGYGAPGYGPPPSAPGYGPPTQHHGGYGPPPPPGLILPPHGGGYTGAPTNPVQPPGISTGPIPPYPVQPNQPYTHTGHHTPVPPYPSSTSYLPKGPHPKQKYPGYPTGYYPKPGSKGIAGTLSNITQAIPALLPAALHHKKLKKLKGKKALKYGLPLAGAGIGAYALSKTFKKVGKFGHWSDSSSSSSSSD